MSKCWYCNNELTSGDNPKHFGICNKCYDEMFKSGDAIIRSLTNKITELQKQLEEKEKDNQFFKKMYLSEKQKNDNYHTEKYALDKPVEELRKIKLTPKEKEIYYKGFDNCERQFATHIAELQQELKSQPAEIVEKIRNLAEKDFDFDICTCCGEDVHDDVVLTKNDFNKILDKVLKEYQK